MTVKDEMEKKTMKIKEKILNSKNSNNILKSSELLKPETELDKK